MGHKRDEDEDDAIPSISFDYMYLTSKEEREQEEQTDHMPIIVMKSKLDRTPKAAVVPEKGQCAYAIKKISQWLKWLGSKRIIWKSDQEPAILALRDAAKLLLTDVEIIPEESPVGESQSNGRADMPVQHVEDVLRARAPPPP